MKRRKLKLWRIEQGLTQDDLATRLKTNAPRISLIESGKQDPSYRLLCAFDKEFNVDNVFDLFKKEGE